MIKTPATPLTDEDTPWTRLVGTPFWKTCQAFYEINHLDYHGMRHIRRIYAWAEALGIPYSGPLDKAIAAHDAIFDGKGDHELRTIDLYRAITGEEKDWTTVYIAATIAHSPSGPGALMAMLDLIDFLDPEVSDENTELLRRESMKLRGDAFDEAGWRAGTAAYLTGLADRIGLALEELPANEEIWVGIMAGIKRTVGRLNQPASADA